MQILWNGLGCFSITAKPAQGEVTLVTNPFKTQDDLKQKGGVASLIATSHDGKDTDACSAFAVEHPEDHKRVFVIEHAGEYEVRGVFVTGVDAPKKDGTPHTIYRFDAEGIHIGFLGALDRQLTAKEIDALGSIDILILPAGGQGVLSPEEAGSVVAEVEPRMVIPSYIDTGSYAPRERVKTVMGCAADELSKLKITKAQLPEEDMRMALLTLA